MNILFAFVGAPVIEEPQEAPPPAMGRGGKMQETK